MNAIYSGARGLFNRKDVTANRLTARRSPRAYGGGKASSGR